MLDNTVAVYQFVPTGNRYELNANIFNRLYRHSVDYDGAIMWGATSSMTPWRWVDLAEALRVGEAVWLKEPLKEPWAICYCEECCPEVLSIWKERSGGKVFPVADPHLVGKERVVRGG